MKDVFLSILVPVLACNATAAGQPAGGWKPEKGVRYTLYLCAGQSNMDGRAKTTELVGNLASYAQPQADVMIRYSSGGLRRKLRTSAGFVPLRPGCNESPTGFGPELSFGRALADAQPDKKILLIKVSEGGTNLHTDWNPDAPNKLYERLIKLTRETRELLKTAGATSELAGMIWLQGESDSGKSQAGRYQERLAAFIARVRADLHAETMPFVIGEVCAANPSFQTIIAAQKAAAKLDPATRVASSAGLKTSDRNVHFNGPAQIEFGKRFAAELKAVRDAIKDIKPSDGSGE